LKRLLIVALALPNEDALQVGAEPLEPRHNGVGRLVFGAEHQRVGWAWTGLAIGKRPAGA